MFMLLNLYKLICFDLSDIATNVPSGENANDVIFFVHSKRVISLPSDILHKTTSLGFSGQSVNILDLSPQNAHMLKKQSLSGKSCCTSPFKVNTSLKLPGMT